MLIFFKITFIVSGVRNDILKNNKIRGENL